METRRIELQLKTVKGETLGDPKRLVISKCRDSQVILTS